MATDAEREAKHDELLEIEEERKEKTITLDEAREAYHKALADVQDVSTREHKIEDEYEAMVVESEPPPTPTQ